MDYYFIAVCVVLSVIFTWLTFLRETLMVAKKSSQQVFAAYGGFPW